MWIHQFIWTYYLYYWTKYISVHWPCVGSVLHGLDLLFGQLDIHEISSGHLSRYPQSSSGNLMDILKISQCFLGVSYRTCPTGLISSCNKTFCNFASFSFRAFFIDNILSSQREFRSSDMHPFVGLGMELLELFLNLSCLVWKLTRLKTVKPFSGVYLLSDGSSWPFHCKIKTPEFAYSAAWTRLADFSSDTIANIGRNWIRGNKIQMNLGTLDVVFYK